jgi:hypothetical protein
MQTKSKCLSVGLQKLLIKLQKKVAEVTFYVELRITFTSSSIRKKLYCHVTLNTISKIINLNEKNPFRQKCQINF